MPLGPSAPQPTRLLAIATILSLIVGTVLAILLERIRGGNMMAEQKLPYSPGMEVMGTVAATGARAEAFMARPP